VRGRQDAGRDQELLAFWQRRAGFGGEAARQRLREVVCLLRADDGAVVGASSAYPANVDLIADWRFWVFRSLLEPGLEEHQAALITGTFDALDAEHETDRDEPVGLCVLLEVDQRRHRPEAEWRDPRMIYAGYLPDGRQVRIAYFTSEVSAMAVKEPEEGWTPPGYRIEPFDRQTAVTAEDVVEVWVSEARIPQPEAKRRVSELLLVAIDPRGSLAGLSTAYLAYNHQLRAEMWHYRTFVREAYRRSNLAVALIVLARDHLIERFVSGEDRRGLGIIFELENEGLKRIFPKGIWYESDFLFIGENPYGAHVRVRYFPGVHAPEPDR
jgi:hypothetical protein